MPEMTEKEKFDQTLATYAARHDNSRGRALSEPEANDRNEFQRDCSRIIHSTSFRQLQYKTQVFSNQEGDLFRTRATHSLEVAQVARSVARSLTLNQDLAETLALAHDIGHAPFGHNGQHILNDLLADHGGFEHNLQGLRIIDELEKPYLGYSGLNMLFETREGVLKHCSAKNAALLGEIGARFLPAKEGAKPYRSPTLEAQLTDISDAIAYTHADLEDGVMMKVLKVDTVAEGVPLFAEAIRELRERYPEAKKGEMDSRLVRMASSMMMKKALADLIQASRENIEQSGVKTLDDVRAAPKLVRFSAEFHAKTHIPFKQFLMKELYLHPDVARCRDQQGEMLKTIFQAYEQNPKWMSSYNPKDKERDLYRQIGDHMAAMTDRYALQEFNRVRAQMSMKQMKQGMSRSAKLG